MEVAHVIEIIRLKIIHVEQPSFTVNCCPHADLDLCNDGTVCGS